MNVSGLWTGGDGLNCAPAVKVCPVRIYSIYYNMCARNYLKQAPTPPKKNPPSDGFRPIFTRSLTVFHVVQVSKWSAWFTNNIFEYDNKLEVCMYVWVILHTLLANIPRNTLHIQSVHLLSSIEKSKWY